MVNITIVGRKAGPVRFYTCVVHLKRQSCTVNRFSSYDQLLRELQSHSKWRKLLLFNDFKIFAKYSSTDTRELNPNEELPVDLPRELFIEIVNRGFSSWKSYEIDALSYIGAPFRTTTVRWYRKRGGVYGRWVSRSHDGQPHG